MTAKNFMHRSILFTALLSLALPFASRAEDVLRALRTVLGQLAVEEASSGSLAR